jgi:hypothetical protein
MASLRGIVAYAVQNQLVGRALKVNVGGVIRCGAVTQVTNPMTNTQGMGFRFVCDGHCGLHVRKASKLCKNVDIQGVQGAGATPVPAPPGLVGVAGTTTVGGGGGSTTSAF